MNIYDGCSLEEKFSLVWIPSREVVAGKLNASM